MEQQINDDDVEMNNANNSSIQTNPSSNSNNNHTSQNTETTVDQPGSSYIQTANGEWKYNSGIHKGKCVHKTSILCKLKKRERTQDVEKNKEKRRKMNDSTADTSTMNNLNFTTTTTAGSEESLPTPNTSSLEIDNDNDDIDTTTTVSSSFTSGPNNNSSIQHTTSSIGNDDVEDPETSSNNSNNNLNNINPEKLLNLFRRTIRLNKLLEKISTEKNDPLRKEIIIKKHIPLLKSKMQQVKFLQENAATPDEFYSLFKDFLSQIEKNQITQILQTLLNDESNNYLLKRAIHLNNKIQNLLKRDFSIRNEFSDDSGSDFDIQADNTDEFVQTILTKYNNIQKAKTGEKNLTGFDFSGQDLTGIVFAEGADFSNANFANANLSNAKMNKCIFKKTILKGATLNKTELKEATITESDLSDTQILAADVNNIKISNNTSLKNATLSDLFFNFATLQDLDCQHITIKNTSFFKCTFKNINMSNSNLNTVSFEKTTLENINLSDSRIEDFIIKNTVLMCNKLYFTNSYLSKCHFIGKTTENAEKRNKIFEKHTIEKFHYFYKAADFKKVCSIMMFCDFSTTRLSDVFFINIFFGLWGNGLSLNFSCQKNLGDISKMESVIFNNTYFYNFVSEEEWWLKSKTEDKHKKTESMLRHKGAIVNKKISDDYELYLEKELYKLTHPIPDNPRTTGDNIKDSANTVFHILGTLGSLADTGLKGYNTYQAYQASKSSNTTSSEPKPNTAQPNPYRPTPYRPTNNVH
jgi:uncharacterized protein YjbI with pentapeptide repeats